jgi:protein-S-isoprenylcysteine O-methyltransferase Ste14
MEDTAWYLRLFYVPIVNLIVSMVLFKIIKGTRMSRVGPDTFWVVVYFAELILWCILLWFVPFRINTAFWVGVGIICFGYVVFILGYSAMREHPEKKSAVVDWGIYRISRHSHVLAGRITTLGALVMGWNFNAPIYIVLWVFFVAGIIMTHFGVINEEKKLIAEFGKEYADYMKRVPRYVGIKGGR